MAKHFACAALVLALLFAPLASHAGYKWQLKRQTETGRIYHPNRWDAELIWRATFFSEHFVDVFVKQHEKIKHLAGDEAARFEAEEMHRQINGWDFFVTIYTKEKYKSFSTYDDTFWRIELTTGSGEVVKPISIEKIVITPYEERMFPHIDRWSDAYRVTFPKVPLGDEIELTLKSVVGTSTLEWKVK